MAKIYGNTLATTMNPNRFQGGNGGSDGGVSAEQVEEMLRMFADTVVSVKADKHDVYLKDEIDLRLGDIDLALDRIIEIQNSFMPGGIPGEPNVPGGDA